MTTDTPCVRIAPDDAAHRVRFDEGDRCVLTPAGIRILAAFEFAARHIGHDITITSAADGLHSGPRDPHNLGSAFDARTRDLPDKHAALDAIRMFLGTVKFYAFIEDEGGPNEHLHVQLRKGMMYP